MKRNHKRKRSSSLKRKLKYLLLLLLISFNFTFTFGHIKKLNTEINNLSRQIQVQESLLAQTDLNYKQLSGEVKNQAIKINILAKREPVTINKTIIEKSEVEAEPTKVNMSDPIVTVSALGVATKLIIDVTQQVAGKLGGIFH